MKIGGWFVGNEISTNVELEEQGTENAENVLRFSAFSACPAVTKNRRLG